MRGNDVTLIQRTLEGDQNAFTALVNKYQKWVHTLVWRKIGDFHIAEEITQDVFLKVYKKLSTLKPPEQFPRWLYVITTRHCIAWLRKKRQPTSSLDAMPAPKLEELCYAQYEASRGEATAVERQREIVKQLLQKLPESERTVVTLHYLAEMSCEEISEFLGVSPNTVKSRLHRARKRLETQEYLLHDVSGIFQLPPSVIGNIMDKISRIKPTTPSVSKPWVPWTLSFSATLLVILMMGFGPRTSSRFQQPYSFDTTSEMVVELIDAPIVRELKRKSDARTQFGKGDTPNKNSGIGRQSELLFVAAVQADGANVSVPEPQWIQTKGPGGISSPGLFLASDRMLYLITETGLYQLTKKADAWAFVSSSGPNREFSPVMAERGDTLYVLTPNEVLVSTDRSKTWDSLGEHPEGRAVALAITDAPQERSIQNADMTMYLVLRTEVFRSKDAGKQWEFIGHVLRSDVVPDTAVPDFRIWDACTVDNMLFVGTNRGLFRFTDNWEKLPVPTPQGIKSLAVAESGLYVGTIVGPRQGTDWSPHASVFYSADLGDLWTDITPSTREHPVKLIAAVEVVPVGDTLMLVGSGGVLLSYDHGKTWVDPGRDPDMSGAFPVVALDESNFYRINYYPSEITRSTDGGHSWHPFMTGLVSSNVQNLIAIKDVLYAVTGGKIAKSADGGESWEIVNMSGGGKLLIPRVETTDDALYVSSIGSNRTQFFTYLLKTRHWHLFKASLISRKTIYTLNGKKGSRKRERRTSMFVRQRSYGKRAYTLSLKKIQRMEGLPSLERPFLWNTDGNFSDGDPAKRRGTTPVWRIAANSRLLMGKDSLSPFRETLSMPVNVRAIFSSLWTTGTLGMTSPKTSLFRLHISRISYVWVQPSTSQRMQG